MDDIKKINKKELTKLLNDWSRQFSVFVPSQESGTARMSAWQGQDIGSLDWYRNTVIPPKDIILPIMEEMFSFARGKDGYNMELPPASKQKQLVFGIRPCDAKALTILDMTFNDAYQDPYYLDHRQNTVLVALTCSNPYDSCFCTALGGSPSDTNGVDLMFTEIGDEFLIEAVTEAGKELLSKTSSLAQATEDDQNKAKEGKEAAYQKMTRSIDIKGIDNRLLASFNDQEFWQRVAAKCISCGICTLLCPTCYCFNINDEMSDKKGARFRSLDSCSFSLYTKMPMENPRQEQWQRVRNRVCHKYEFYPSLFNTIACTGCGRCIRLCPVNWDITQTLNSLPRQ
jgi:sulfhydrogenase subunit beta (sulfur reductase)